MSERISQLSYAVEIEELLDRCVIKNGKLVPAPRPVDEPVSYDYADDTQYDDVSDQKAMVVQGELVSEADIRGKRIRSVLTRVAFIGAITIFPIQAADAFTSNRPFPEVNIAADAFDAVKNASVIGNNVSTGINDTISTIVNVVKFANGGR